MEASFQRFGFRSRLQRIQRSGSDMRKSGILGVFVILAAFAGVAFAQSSTGTLTGKVVNAKGKAIPGARVIVSGTADAEAKTDAKGVFRMELNPGEYRLQFEAEGYSNASL